MEEKAITDKADITAGNARSRAALNFVLGSADTRAAFTAFCKAQLIEEIVLFVLAVRQHQGLLPGDVPAIVSSAAALMQQYFTPGSGTEVNIDGATRAALSARIASGYADPHMFDSVAEVCEKELAGDVMPKFVKSGEWRALCGMDPLMGTPLLPAPTPPPITPKSPTAPPEAIVTLADINSGNSRSKAALSCVLANPAALSAFVTHSKSQHCDENILFWVAVRDFKAAPLQEQPGRSAALYRKFLGPECEMEVNIDAKSAGALGARIACGDVSVDMYDALIATVEKEMAGDALPRFVKSDVWKALVAASPAASPAPTPVSPTPDVSEVKKATPMASRLSRMLSSRGDAMKIAAVLEPKPVDPSLPSPTDNAFVMKSPLARGVSTRIRMEPLILSKSAITEENCKGHAAFQFIMQHADTCAALTAHCAAAGCGGLVPAWASIAAFQALPANGKEQLKTAASSFASQFLLPDAPTPLALDERLLSPLRDRVSAGDVSALMFDGLQSAVEKELSNTHIPALIKTPEWRSLIPPDPAPSLAPVSSPAPATPDVETRPRASSSIGGLFGRKGDKEESPPAPSPPTPTSPAPDTPVSEGIKKKSDITAQNCRSRPALMYVLGEADTLAAFIAFNTSQHSEENVLVWTAIRDFKALAADPAALLASASEIVRRFIGPTCELEVNLDARSKAALVARIDSADVSVDMFDRLQATLEKEMAGDQLPRFIKSAAWQALLALDVEIEAPTRTSSQDLGSKKKKSSIFSKRGKKKEEEEVAAPVSIVIDRIALGNTLRRAALLGNQALVASSLNSGAGVNDADPNGFTALHAAACGGDFTTLRLLLRKGANVNAQDKAGDTPLIYACMKNHIRVVEELAKSGADLTIKGLDGLHGGQIAEREGFRDIARFFRASGLIGEMNLTTGVKLESVMSVADGSSGDKWQPRIFVLSELLQAIVFWIGTKTDIIGSVSQLPFQLITRVNKPSKLEPCLFSIKVSSGRGLVILASDAKEAREWAEKVSECTRTHIAAYKIQTAVRRMLAYRAARRRRKHFVHAIRLIKKNSVNESGPVRHYTHTKSFGFLKSVGWTRRFLVLWRSEGQLRTYKSRAAFETLRPPLSVYDVKSFASIYVDMEVNVLEIKQWKGSVVRLKMEYDDDMVRWTTALQSVLPTLNVAATLIQAAWRRLKARKALPYLRSRSVALKMSVKYGVSTVLLHAAANRIRKGWRNALWAAIMNKRLRGKGRILRRDRLPTSPSAVSFGDQESKSTPRLTLQDAVMDAAGDEIETHFHKHRRPSAAASVLVFADADEWFDRQLASLRLGKEGRTGADITAQPTLISDKEMVAALTELMRLDLLRRMTPRVSSAPAAPPPVMPEATPRRVSAAPAADEKGEKEGEPPRRDRDPSSVSFDSAEAAAEARRKSSPMFQFSPDAVESPSHNTGAEEAVSAAPTASPEPAPAPVSESAPSPEPAPAPAPTPSQTSKASKPVDLMQGTALPGELLALPIADVLQRYLVAVTGQKVEFLESTSRAARAAAIAAKQPVPAKQPVAFGRSNSVVIKQDLKKPTPPPQRPPWLRTGDDKGVVTPSAIKATPPDRVVSAVSYFKKKVPVVKSNSRRSFVHTRYDDLSTSEEEEEDEQEREGQGGDAPGEMHVRAWDDGAARADKKRDSVVLQPAALPEVKEDAFTDEEGEDEDDEESGGDSGDDAAVVKGPRKEAVWEGAL